MTSAVFILNGILFWLMQVVKTAVKKYTTSIFSRFVAGLPVLLFLGMWLSDFLQILSPSSLFVSLALLLHVLGLGMAFVLALPQIFRYMVTLPSYNHRKLKATMTFEEVLCTVSASIFAVTFLFRWTAVLPVSFLIWPEGLALLILIIANRRRLVFVAHSIGNAIMGPIKQSVGIFRITSQE